MKLYYAKSPLISSDIYPMQYGEQQCDRGYAFGPAVRNFYLIHYVYSGQGKLYVENQIYKIRTGQFFLICPKQTAYYQADDNDPWFYRWIEFDGSFAKKLMTVAGFSSEKHVLTDENHVGDALKDIIDLGWSDFETIMSNFWSFIAVLTKGKLLARDIDTAEAYVMNAENYIRSNLHKKTTITEIAEFLNIDRSHLTRVFKDIRGISTQQFLLKSKMDMAARYLRKSSMSIKEIANSVGYNNQMEFSKMFKKHYNMTPTQWRQESEFQQSINHYETSS